MTEFLDILTHGRRLQGAVKNLSIEELESVLGKLESLIEKRKQLAKEEKAKQKEKLEKIALIKKQMQEAGVDISDLESETNAPKLKKKGKKRPVKYRLKDNDGNTHEWTGIGRMPVVYKKALESGQKLSDFAI
ncbi:H-NS histone family protein [Alteromonas sediminis]|uniref:DNA-binding protein n=1 Tax=Alteromonas sediminis TaxID=2259342 RepID=A0A3N5Z959_9ALTE|nr:H-NS family nucleoid-associated regulatory protein [Alteromonas sediminis]RPJ67504.1 H-NS histone family protein [Alteromonas sediminis]